MNNSPRLVNPRRLALFAALLLAGLLLLLFSAREVIREVVVLPLSYLFWVVRVFLVTTPQIFFWGVLLALGALAAYRSLAGRRKVYQPAPLDQVDDGYGSLLQGQVAYWALRVNLLRQSEGGYFRASFHQGVGRILFDALSHRHRLTAQQVEEQLRDGTLEVPSEVRQYALNSLRRSESALPGLPLRLWQRTLRLLDQGRSALLARAGRSAQPAHRRPPSEDEQRVMRVLQYLEEEWEVSNGNTGR